MLHHPRITFMPRLAVAGVLLVTAACGGGKPQPQGTASDGARPVETRPDTGAERR